MTAQEYREYILEQLNELDIDIPVYFNHYPTGVELPIIVYDCNDNNFGADDIVYHKNLRVFCGYYNVTRDLTTESALEGIFTSAKWYYLKETEFDAENGVYITTYTMEV